MAPSHISCFLNIIFTAIVLSGAVVVGMEQLNFRQASHPHITLIKEPNQKHRD